MLETILKTAITIFAYSAGALIAFMLLMLSLTLILTLIQSVLDLYNIIVGKPTSYDRMFKRMRDAAH